MVGQWFAWLGGKGLGVHLRGCRGEAAPPQRSLGKETFWVFDSSNEARVFSARPVSCSQCGGMCNIISTQHPRSTEGRRGGGSGAGWDAVTRWGNPPHNQGAAVCLLLQPLCPALPLLGLVALPQTAAA